MLLVVMVIMNFLLTEIDGGGGDYIRGGDSKIK